MHQCTHTCASMHASVLHACCHTKLPSCFGCHAGSKNLRNAYEYAWAAHLKLILAKQSVATRLGGKWAARTAAAACARSFGTASIFHPAILSGGRSVSFTTSLATQAYFFDGLVMASLWQAVCKSIGCVFASYSYAKHVAQGQRLYGDAFVQATIDGYVHDAWR